MPAVHRQHRKEAAVQQDRIPEEALQAVRQGPVLYDEAGIFPAVRDAERQTMLCHPAGAALAKAEHLLRIRVSDFGVGDRPTLEILLGLISHPERDERGVHQGGGGADGLVQHRIHIQGRADELGQPGEGLQAREAGRQPFVQARVFDRDRRLVGEERQDLAILVCEWAVRSAPPDCDHAQEAVLVQERLGEHGLDW